MQIKRMKQIIALALDYALTGDVEPTYSCHAVTVEGVDYNNGIQHELAIDGHSLMSPTDAELVALQDPKKTKFRGGSRTLQVLRYALAMMPNMEGIPEEYRYYGEIERYVDTHVTLDGENFRFPSTEELDSLSADLVRISKWYPMLSGHISWDVHCDLENGDAFSDTVFQSCDTVGSEVRRSLIDHDGYNPAIVLRVSRSPKQRN